jgi:hypothetical protein
MIRSGHPEVVHYPISQAKTPPLSGTRQTGIDRAWRQEVELIKKTGKGTAAWTADEIAAINAGKDYRDLGYTGHHINKVSDFPAWQGDPRNIAFLKQGVGESHMGVGHPGGTRAPQPTGDLIDRQAMLDKLGR